MFKCFNALIELIRYSGKGQCYDVLMLRTDFYASGRHLRYFRECGCHSKVAGRHLRYLRGRGCRSPFYLANVNKKLLHFVGILQNEAGELSAIFETVLAHMDLNARKVTEFSDQKLKKLLEYSSANKLIEDLPFDLKLKIRDLNA